MTTSIYRSQLGDEFESYHQTSKKTKKHLSVSGKPKCKIAEPRGRWEVTDYPTQVTCKSCIRLTKGKGLRSGTKFDDRTKV